MTELRAEDLFDPEELSRWKEENTKWKPGGYVSNSRGELPGALQVYWQPDGLAVVDHGGFLTFLEWTTRTPDEAFFELQAILQIEFDHPGALRKALTGQSYRWDERTRGRRPAARPLTLDDIIGDLT